MIVPELRFKEIMSRVRLTMKMEGLERGTIRFFQNLSIYVVSYLITPICS